MWVVKLGGSLWDSPYLADWLQQLERVEQPLVVVPGGGPFADQVRTVQARWGFDDATAHAMALRGMEQMAQMLCAMQPGMVPAAEADEMRHALRSGRVPVWLPSRMVLAEPAIAASWRVTSDSLAVWLASVLNASGVLLVKSVELPVTVADVGGLQRSGLLDAAFDGYLRHFPGPVWMMSRKHSATLAAVLDGREGPMLSVAC